MGVNINTSKTKFLIITREPDGFEGAILRYEDALIERVNKYKYLGTWLCEDWTSDAEIKSHIEMARGAFSKFKRVFTCTEFDLDLRIRFTKCYISLVLLWNGGLNLENGCDEQVGSV